METSAKEGINIHQAFHHMGEQIYYSMKSVMSQTSNDLDSQISDSLSAKNINLALEKKRTQKKKCCN